MAKTPEEKRKTLLEWRHATGRSKPWRPCKAEGCHKRIRSDNTHDFCRDHRHKARKTSGKPRAPRKWKDASERRHARYMANKEKEYQSAAAWRAANPERWREIARQSSRRYKERKLLAELEEARWNPKPNEAALRLLKLATARAAGVKYGYSRPLNPLHR